MNYSIQVMKEEHENIIRMITVIRKACMNILEGGEPDTDDFRKMIDFIRNYADKHHHGKEEEFLFPEMVKQLGRVAENLVTHGMLVEHELGRSHVLDLEEALAEYDKAPGNDAKLDIITEAMGYGKLLSRHIEKENGVVYTFAERQLSRESFEEINSRCLQFEQENREKGIQEKYLGLLEELEAGYSGEEGVYHGK